MSPSGRASYSHSSVSLRVPFFLALEFFFGQLRGFVQPGFAREIIHLSAQLDSSAALIRATPLSCCFETRLEFSEFAIQRSVPMFDGKIT